VVGNFQNNASPDIGDLNGFHVQDFTGDGDAITLDGVFVYGSSVDVAMGDAVRIRGSVSEYYDMTEVSASQIWVCSSGNDLPAAAELQLPVTDLSDYEPTRGRMSRSRIRSSSPSTTTTAGTARSCRRRSGI
jgi:hypothetical protein